MVRNLDQIKKFATDDGRGATEMIARTTERTDYSRAQRRVIPDAT
jgi:hypothetical protein